MPRKIITPQLAQRVLDLLKDGCSIHKTADIVKLKYATVYRFAKSKGWKREDRDLSKHPNKQRDPKTYKTKTTITKEEMLSLYDEGFNTSEIAERAGCSRQYIHYVISKSDRTPIRDKINARQAARKKAQERSKEEKAQARLKVLIERWREPREWWDQGLSLKEIAAKLNTTSNSLGVSICKYRKKYGWFPRRRTHGT